MKKTVGIVEWKTSESDEMPMWYRVDEPGAGERLFRHLKDNAENDGREILSYKTISEAEWQEAERQGQEMA